MKETQSVEQRVKNLGKLVEDAKKLKFDKKLIKRFEIELKGLKKIVDQDEANKKNKRLAELKEKDQEKN